jgi:hypothetical protein
MEVFLKKAKITASVLKQMSRATPYEISTFEVLGYCNNSDLNWIVLYNNTTHELRKYALPVRIECVELYDNKSPNVIVSFGNKHEPLYYPAQSKEASNRAKEIFETLKKTALEKGQFYL